MKTIVEPFFVLGISVRTTNENGQAATDIPKLWNQFMTENVMEQIPNKISTAIYSVYTEYEKDHTQPYTAVLGCKVSTLDLIPEGMKGLTIAGGPYLDVVAKGDLAQGAVYQEWVKIWEANATLNRKFTADFEVYDEKAQGENAEVHIFVAVH